MKWRAFWRRPRWIEEFRAVLKYAIDAIVGAESFEKPYPLILFRDFFPADFYRRLLRCFPDVDRFAGLNGDGTRREYALYDERSDPGSDEGREIWGIVRRVLCVARDRLGAAGESWTRDSGSAPRGAARDGRSRCIRGRCSIPTSTATRSSPTPTPAGRS